MREGWEYKKLGDLCQITMGQSPDGNSINEVDGIEFHQGKTCFGERFLGVSSLFSNAPTKLAEANSVLLCVRAPVGYPNITERRICIGRGLCAINAKKEVENQYLFYALLKKQDYFEKNATGSTFKAISSKIISNAEIPLPPKSTQLAIVSELDKINELIRLKKEQLVEYDNLAQSIFYEMFGDPMENEKGWEVKKLIDVCTKITDGKHGGCTILPESEFFFVGAREITNDSVNYRTAQHISEAEFNKDYARCNVEIGDLLLVNTGATIGKSAIAKDKRSTKTLLQKSVALLKVNKKYLTAPYLQYCYKMNQHMYQVSGASAQANLLLSQIKKTEILLPPLPLQQSFASRIEQIEKLKSEVQNAITDLETLLASRMQYWFE